MEIGVGVVIVRNGKILLGKRKSKHGEGTWGFPGGHLESGESVKECARRETREETGLSIQNPQHLAFTEDLFNSGKHYITLYIQANTEGGEPEIKEPDKVVEWRWYSVDKLPDNLFLPVQNFIEAGFLTKLTT